MTPEQQMTFFSIAAVILFGVAGILFAMAQISYEKSKKLHREADSIKNDSIDITNLPIRYGIEKTNYFFDVYAVCKSVDGNREARMLVKRFVSLDDPDFALLEAQELLDHLNEK